MGAVVSNEYVLGDLLGRGGMGSVYAAVQRSLGRSVAIKLMHPELATSPTIVERFRTEAIAGSRLSHPNIAGVVDFGTTPDGVPFLVMARVSGEPLGTIIEREGALSLRRGCGLVFQILSGLGEAHANGIVHADVKSDNILVDVDKEDLATLIDFGIARLADQPTRRDIDEGGELMLSGTPEYLAPEVIRGGAPTSLSDLYAVGIILYELVTGSTPFAGGRSIEILQRHLDEDVVAPGLRRPDRGISAAFDRVVLRALAKDPIERFPTAHAFARALREAMPERDVAGDAIGSAFSTETSTQEWRSEEIPATSAARRWLAVGTRPHPLDECDELRKAIGHAIAIGCLDEIAKGYLALARHLVDQHDLATGVQELQQAVDILTSGDGSDTECPPSQLWRVLLAQAALFDGIGERVDARRVTVAAALAAARVDSEIGRDRARNLLRRLGSG